MSQDKIRARLFTTVQEDGEHILIGRAAMRVSAGKSILIESQLDSQTRSNRPVNPQNDLLPLPQNAQRLLSRSDINKQLLFQLVSVNTTQNQLEKQWRAKGWTLQPSANTSDHSFEIICHRHATTIYVWAHQISESSNEFNLMIFKSEAQAYSSNN